jgi:hypothetical protein
MRTVAGIFDDPEDTGRALDEIRAAGYDPHAVSVIANDPERARQLANETGAEVATGTATGAGLGALLGGAAGWLVGVGVLAIPGFGPIVGAGPLAAALGVAGTTAVAAAGVGVVAGSYFGALTGWGFSEAEARTFEARVRDGAFLLAVQLPDGQDTGGAEQILKRAGGNHVITGSAFV